MTAFQRKQAIVQILRRCVQAGSIALIVTLSFLGLYHHYYAARALDQIDSVGGWRGAALAAVDRRMDAIADPSEFLARNNGNLWSMRLAGKEISDPLAFVEASAAGKRFHLPLLISILVPVLATVLLGRIFCSWICPGYVVFELAGRFRKLLPRLGIEPARIELSHTNKYAVLAAGILTAIATGLPIFSMFYPRLC